MNPRLILLALFLMQSSFVHLIGQGASMIVPGDFQRFDVDQLGNIYAITRSNQLRKYTGNGDSVSVFNDIVRYGRLTRLDVSNPLRILLFYRDFGTIVLLDRMLKPVDAIDLRRRSMLQVTTAAVSYDNHCWIYDEQEARLRKIDAQGRILLESPDLRMIMDNPPVPSFMFDQNAMVTLYDEQQGFFQFDLYAAYRRMIPAQGWTNVRGHGNFLEGIKSGQMHRLNLLTGDLSSYRMIDLAAGATQIIPHPTGIYFLSETGIQVIKRDRLIRQ